MSSSDPSTFSNQEAQAVFNMVVKNMQEARSVAVGHEEARLVYLRAAKDLILTKNPDLIDNFWNEMLATRHERSLPMISFCLDWIRDACAKEPSLLSDAIPIVLQLMEHQSVVVQKRTLQTATEIYRNAFCWMVQPGRIENDARALWTELSRVKDHVAYAVREDYEQSHLGYRLMSYKFMEIVITCQSPRDAVFENPVPADDPASSLDIPAKFQFLSPESVEEESMQLFQTLEDYLTVPAMNIKYVDRISICGCLFNLAKRRAHLLPRILTAIEFVHGNIPESYSKLQVESLRKYLKVGLISVLKRSNDGEMLGRIVQLLVNLGASNSEVTRARPKVYELMKRRKRESSVETSAKRLKSHDESRVSTTDIMATDLHALATDINTSAIAPRLTPDNVVELVLSNMRKLPSTIPTQFHATYTPIGSGPMEGIIQHLARLISVQMVAAAVGPGPEEVIRRRQEELALKRDAETAAVESEELEPRPITSVLSKPAPVVVKKLEEDEADGDSMDSTDAAKIVVESQEVPDAFKATEKAFRVSEITEPIPKDDRGNAILSIVNELISSDTNVMNACGEYLYHKCLIRFAVKVGLDSLREKIMKFILEDISSRAELAFRWIYEEYAAARQMKRNPTDNRKDELKNYDDCLCKFIKGFIDHAEYREGLVSALYLEVPVITDGAIELLNYYCAERNLHGAMRLIQKLVTTRPNAHRYIVPALEMTLYQRKDVQTQAVQTCVKMYETVPDLRVPIREYAVGSIKLLCDVARPPSWFFTEKFGRGIRPEEYLWTEEYQKLCTTLFTGLLSEDPSLLPVLGEIYVDHPSDVKKTIFKVIEQPMKTMVMNAPEVLQFVRSPPKGSESLVLRMIHLLTETHPATTELISSIRNLYNERIPDVRFLIPILNGLPKEDIFAALPKLIKLNPVVVQEVFHRLLGSGKHKLDSTQRKPLVTPAEVFIEIHKIDLGKVDAKTLIKATGMCLEEKDLYPSETMVQILQKLTEVEPLPFLLMRTVLQTIQMHPRLVPFIMTILQRLITKEVWMLPLLWEGFVKCCEKTMPNSYSVLLQLPAEQLRRVLDSNASIKLQLQKHIGDLNERQKSQIPEQILHLVRTGKILTIRTEVELLHPIAGVPTTVESVVPSYTAHNGNHTPIVVIKLEDDTEEAPAQDLPQATDEVDPEDEPRDNLVIDVKRESDVEESFGISEPLQETGDVETDDQANDSLLSFIKLEPQDEEMPENALPAEMEEDGELVDEQNGSSDNESSSSSNEEEEGSVEQDEVQAEEQSEEESSDSEHSIEL